MGCPFKGQDLTKTHGNYFTSVKNLPHYSSLFAMDLKCIFWEDHWWGNLPLCYSSSYLWEGATPQFIVILLSLLFTIFALCFSLKSQWEWDYCFGIAPFPKKGSSSFCSKQEMLGLKWIKIFLFKILLPFSFQKG